MTRVYFPRTMPQHDTEAASGLEETLRLCERKVGAAKGALYLANTPDGPFDLTAWYGFPGPPRKQVPRTDTIVERLRMRQSAYWVNGVSTDARLYELLYHANSRAILVYPLFLRGRLAGFLDLRDKGRRGDFGPEDVAHAKEVAEQLLRLLTPPAQRVEGQREADTGKGADEMQRVIQRAEVIVRRDLGASTLVPRTLTEPEVAAGARVLPTILQLPGVVAAAFTAFGHLGTIQHVVSKGEMSEEAVERFDEKLKQWVQKQWNMRVSATPRSTLLLPFGDSGPRVQPANVKSVLSAPVSVRDIPGLVVSVVFEETPQKQARAMLAVYHRLLEQTLEYALSHLTVRTKNQRIAERLLEPDFSRFPELVDHSMRIALLSEQFAHYLQLSPAETEVIRLAAYVHDVGMRLLDYSRLYRKPTLNPDDQALIRNHPTIGAALVSESALGEEVARIVLTHHEQVDGKGYPHGITGDAIPLGARIIQICDAFDAMTSLHSYKEPVPESAALASIVRLGGSQFDSILAQKFNEMLVRASTFGM